MASIPSFIKKNEKSSTMNSHIISSWIQQLSFCHIYFLYLYIFTEPFCLKCLSMHLLQIKTTLHDHTTSKPKNIKYFYNIQSNLKLPQLP